MWEAVSDTGVHMAKCLGPGVGFHRAERSSTMRSPPIDASRVRITRWMSRNTLCSEEASRTAAVSPGSASPASSAISVTS